VDAERSYKFGFMHRHRRSLIGNWGALDKFVRSCRGTECARPRSSRPSECSL